MNTPSRNESQALIQSIIEILDQGERLLTEISDDAYTRKIPAAFNASIGGHYRHCLDHCRSLLEAAPTGGLNYDQRERGTLVENDRFAALNATRELRESWRMLPADTLGRVLLVTCQTRYTAGTSQTAASSVGREVMYVVAHAVHHYAVIGIMSTLMELNLPAGFGVAPSTLKHQAGVAKTV